MMDFKEKARISKETNEVIKSILSKKQDTFELIEEVDMITDLEVAKMVIKRLISRVQL